MDADLDALTDELYAHPPTEFVARRDELARQARDAGDRVLAARIRALRRPSVGAWYLNTAVRSGLTSLRELVHLGEELRAAQAGGDFGELRELAARRGPLVTRVLRDLTAHLAQLGVTATASGLDEVRTTLAGVLADPVVSQEVLQARLDGPRSYSGFGELAWTALPSPDKAESTPAVEDATGAQQAAEQTRRDLRRVEAELADAATRREAAEQQVRAARERVEALQRDLVEARLLLASAEADLAAATDDEGVAGKRLEDARHRLDTLESS